MLVRMAMAAVLSVAAVGSGLGTAWAGEMNADEARKFVAGKVFAFTCFDGTRGAGRIFDDGSAAGAIQFSGGGPIRHMRLPGNTLQTRGQAICASLKGLPFEPCFNLTRSDDRSFRGAVSGMGFAYCDFNHQGGTQMLMARAQARPRAPRSLRPPVQTQAADARTDITSRVETPRVESTKIEPAKPVPAAPETSLDLRKSTD